MKSPIHKRFYFHAWSQNSPKVQAALIHHVYSQLPIGLASSLFCATLIFLSLVRNTSYLNLVLLWFGFFIGITLIRFSFYLSQRNAVSENLTLWRSLYLLGSLLGGLSWGILGIVFLPMANSMQQMLMILMLAGVTAGAVPLSAALPGAAILFLTLAILPFIATLSTFDHSIFLLFTIALSLYLVYSIALTLKVYALIRNSIILQFENDALLDDLEISNQKLILASTHDPLTKLPNRRYFEQRFQHLLKRTHLKNPFALLFIDLDHFKEANDRHGHQAGDCILTTISFRLTEKFQGNKMVARLGGDELAIIIERPADIERIEQIAEEICTLIAKPIPFGNIHLYVTASIGISFYPHDGDSQDQLLKNADKRMYAVKRQGGNSYHLPTKVEMD